MKKNKSKLTSQILSKYVKKYANGGPGDDLVAKQDNTRTNSYTPKQELSEEGKVWAKNEWDKALKKREEELSNYSKKGMLSAMKEPVDIKSYAEQSLRYNESSTSDKLKDAAVDLTLGLAPELVLGKFGKAAKTKNWYDNYHKGKLTNSLPSSGSEFIQRGVADQKAIDDLLNTGIVRNRVSADLPSKGRWGEKVYWGEKGDKFASNKFNIIAKNSKELENRPVTLDDIVDIQVKTPEGYKSYFNSKEPFKSEVDWTKWNKEIPDNKSLVDEYNSIEQSSKANNTWMKNPDGSIFQGTPEQFVQQNSENFKKAFGNSKLVNPDGSPTIQYHGSAKKFDTFDESKFQLGDAGYSGVGIYTTPSKSTAESYAMSSSKFHSGKIEPTVYELYGQANNPISSSQLIKENKGRDLFNFHRKNNWKGELTPEESLMQFDAAIADQLPNVERIRPWNDAREIVFPSNKQLKSAIGNNGMFDMSNPNIYKTVIPGVLGTAALTNEENMKKYGGLIRKKYDVGGQLPGDDKPKTYTNKAEYDKALQAYNDSLNLYKAYQFQKSNILPPPEGDFRNEYNQKQGNVKGQKKSATNFLWNQRYGDDYSNINELEKAYPNENNKKVADYYKTLKFNSPTYIGYHSSPDLYSKDINPIASYFDGNAYSPVYKKPTINPQEIYNTQGLIPEVKPTMAKGTMESEPKPINQLMMPSGSYMQKDDFIKRYGEKPWMKATGQKFAYGGKMKYDVGGNFQSMNADGTYGVQEQPQDNTQWANMVGMAGNIVQGTQNYSKSPNASMYKTEDTVWDTVGQMGPVGAVVGGVTDIMNSALRPVRESNDKKAGTSGYSDTTTIAGGLLNPLAALQTRSQYEGGYGDISGKGYEKYMAGKNKQAKFKENIGVFDDNLNQNNNQIDYLSKQATFADGGNLNSDTLNTKKNYKFDVPKRNEELERKNREIYLDSNQDKFNINDYINYDITEPGLKQPPVDPTDILNLPKTLGTGVASIATKSLFNKGGKMCADGGQMTTVYENGGTHESNPLGGIPIGQDSLVEEGEVRFDYKDKSKNLKSYIFSNKIKYK